MIIFKMGCGSSNINPEPISQNIRNTISKITSQKQKKSSKKIAKNLNSFSQLLQQLKQLLVENEYYDFLFRGEYLLQMLCLGNKYYVNHQETIKIINIILQYMALSKNFINGRQTLTTGFKVSTFAKDISQRWTEIKKTVHESNRNCLRTFNYLAYGVEESKCLFSHSFLLLKFDFSMNQAIKVGEAVREICKYDQRAFCYFINYLLKCSKEQFEKTEDIIKVQIRLNNLLEQIQTVFTMPLPLNGQSSLFDHHPSFKIQLPENHHFSLDLKFTNRNQRVQTIENFIFNKAKYSMKYFDKFNKLFSQICHHHGCIHYQSQVRLKSRSQKSETLKIKEQFSGYKPKKDQSLMNKNTKLSFDQFINSQEERYSKQVNSYCQTLSGSIKFKVYNLLKSQCRFDDLNKLNECCASLVKAITKQGYKLIQLINQLRGVKGVPHILLRIIINQIICQFKLIFQYNLGEYYFAQYLEKILKQKQMSSLTTLKLFNQQLSNDLLRESFEIIQTNIKSQQQYKQKLTFAQLKPFFKEFISILPFKLDLSKKHHKSIDFNLIFDPIQQYKLIEEQFIDGNVKIQLTDKIKRIAEYLFYEKNFNLSELLFGLYQKEVQDHNAYLINKIKDKSKNYIAAEIQLIKSYSSSLHFIAQINKEKHAYSKQIQFQQKYMQLNRLISFTSQDANCMKRIAEAYKLDKKYDEAIKIYNQCIDIQQNKESLDVAEIHHLLSVVLLKAKNIQEALKHQSIRLKIIQKTEKGSHLQALSLKHIAQIYKRSANYSQVITKLQQSKQILQTKQTKYCKLYAQIMIQLGVINKKIGNYSKSLFYYQQGLEVMQRIQGDHHLQTQKLYCKIGNLYQQLGNYHQALEKYKKSLFLAKTVLGSNNLQVAIILNSIGLAYQNIEQYEQALSSYFKCLQIKKTLLGSKNIEYIKVVINIGVVYDQQGRSKQALQKYKQSLSLLQAQIGTQNSHYAKVLNNIALAQHNQGHYQQALKHFKMCLEIKQAINGQQNGDYATTLSNMAMVYDDTCNYQEALKNYHKCMVIFQKLKDQPGLSATLHNIGTSQMHLGHYAQALKYYEKSLSLEEHLKGPQSREYSLCLHSLGIIKLQQGHYEQAQKLYEKAKLILKKHLHSSGLEYSQILDSIGKLYLKNRRIDQSLIFFEQELQILQKIKGKDDPSCISALLNKGIAFICLKRYKESKVQLENALRICEKDNLKYRLYAAILFNLGILLLNQQRYFKAIKLFQRAILLQQKYCDSSWKLTASKLAICSSIVQRNKISQIYISYSRPQTNQPSQNPNRKQAFS